MKALYLLLATAIVAGYIAALWRLLRSETQLRMWIVATLSAVSLAAHRPSLRRKWSAKIP